jgi:hypothetical protein
MQCYVMLCFSVFVVLCCSAKREFFCILISTAVLVGQACFQSIFDMLNEEVVEKQLLESSVKGTCDNVDKFHPGRHLSDGIWPVERAGTLWRDGFS